MDEDGKAKAFETARGFLNSIPQAKNAAVGPPISSRLSRGYSYGKLTLLAFLCGEADEHRPKGWLLHSTTQKLWGASDVSPVLIKRVV